jgi:lysozyme
MIKESTIQLLRELEGVEYKVYKDSAGLPTIGVGHLLKKGENYTEITDAEVNALLYLDLNIAAHAIETNVFVTLNQNQYDALISLVFNIGTGAFRRSQLLKMINRNASRELIVKHWSEWRKAGGEVVPGLVNRRAKELKLWFKPVDKI